MNVRLFLPLLLALSVSCSSAPGSGGSGSALGGKPAVVASFYPLQEVAMKIGGERVDVTNLTAAGAEPHDLELTPRDIERLDQARLLVYIGAGFQPALDKALEAKRSPNLTALDVLKGMQLIEGEADDEDGAPSSGGTQMDPHVWLDPTRMQVITTRVRDTLVQVDPSGRETYEANAKKYSDALAALDQQFRAGLKNCKQREIVTSHAAFGYLAKQYGLEQVAITGLSPEAEPSPRRMQEVAQLAKSHNVKVIFFETLVDPKVADTIAREAGAKTMVLNPIEGLTTLEQAEGKGYIDLMRQNLTNLRTALDCS
jgi:zinc transport system substrate-binding protein